MNFQTKLYNSELGTAQPQLVFNVFSYIFKIKDKKRTAYRSNSLQQVMALGNNIVQFKTDLYN